MILGDYCIKDYWGMKPFKYSGQNANIKQQVTMSVRGVIVLSAYKINDGTVGESFAVIKGAHFKMGMFNVGANLYLF